MVARVTLHNMRQDRAEIVRSYGARLRGQAGISKYVIKCPGCEDHVNYTDAMFLPVELQMPRYSLTSLVTKSRT